MAKQEMTETAVAQSAVTETAVAAAEPAETLEGKTMMPGLFIRRVMSRGNNGKQYANYTLNGTFNGNPIHADFEVNKRDTKIVRGTVADVQKGDYVGYDTLNVLFGFSDELPLYVENSTYTRGDGVVVKGLNYFVGSLDKESGVSLCVKLSPVTAPSKNVAEMLVKKAAVLNKIDIGL